MSEEQSIWRAYDATLRAATRMRVLGFREPGDGPGERVLGVVSGAALAEAVELLRVTPAGVEAGWLCECEALTVYELGDGSGRTSEIWFHGCGHGEVRGVEAIFNFARGDEIERWLSTRGIVDPRM
ncbi:MAG: hypothetical protein U0326_08575 [Polyangiales bacterium]